MAGNNCNERVPGLVASGSNLAQCHTFAAAHTLSDHDSPPPTCHHRTYPLPRPSPFPHGPPSPFTSPHQALTRRDGERLAHAILDMSERHTCPDQARFVEALKDMFERLDPETIRQCTSDVLRDMIETIRQHQVWRRLHFYWALGGSGHAYLETGSKTRGTGWGRGHQRAIG